jgi:sugar lactone lactonase YvrE
MVLGSVRNDPACILAAGAVCGESPVWDEEGSALWWVDIHGCRVHRTRWPDVSDEAWPAPGRPSCLALLGNGGLAVAVERTLFAFDRQSGHFTPLADCTAEPPAHRFNDGRCDRFGRLWIGTLPEALDMPSGGLLRYDSGSRRFHRVFGGLIVPNGLGFSPDGATMYHADSRARTIWRRPFDVVGEPGSPSVFATFEEGEGRPDGAAVDAEGFYWAAHVTGGRLTRFAPDGRRDRVVPLPVSRPTMCAFGGPDLDILFVTSGTEHLTQAQLAEEPHAGGLFAFRPGVRGLLEPRLA